MELLRQMYAKNMSSELEWTAMPKNVCSSEVIFRLDLQSKNVQRNTSRLFFHFFGSDHQHLHFSGEFVFQLVENTMND